MTKSKTALIITSSVIGFLLISLAVWMNTIHIESALGRIQSVEYKKIELPWHFEPKGLATVKLEVLKRFGSSNIWHVIPDDKVLSIRVNDELVDLSRIPKEALSDYHKGFRLDLSNYLIKGKNTVLISFRNKWHAGSLTIFTIPSFLSCCFILLGFTLVAVALASIFQIKHTQLFIVIVAVCLVCIYWSKTDWQTRTHDVGGASGHYGYIKYITDNKALPAPDTGWVYYHPPLYYLSASGIKKWADFINADDHALLQSYSIILWLLFLIPSLSIFQRVWWDSPHLVMAASVSLATWPSGIIHSVRLGNDSAFYACTGIAFWALANWWFNNKRSYLLVSSLFCALALLSKSNAIIMCGCLGLCVLFRFFQASGFQLKLQRVYDGGIALSFFVIGIVLSFATRIYFFLKGDIDNWFVSNAGGLNHLLKVPSNIKAFIPLDLPTFITETHMNPWSDESGRGNFWNYLFRSSISGEFNFPGIAAEALSVLLGILLLVVITATVVQVLKSVTPRLSVLEDKLPFSLLIILFISGLIALRIIAPYACSNDFRYILPILPAFLVFSVGVGPKIRFIHYIFAILSSALIISI